MYLRALQGHSGRGFMNPTLQDNVIFPDPFFKYIHHVGCAINLHSIINSGLIPGGQNLSDRQTVFFLPVDPMDKNHIHPDTIDLRAPRHAQYMHEGWKKHQNTVYWIDINLALKKGLELYQTRSNAIILHNTLPAYCIPKVVRMETGEVIFEKVYASPRPPPKISLKHDWMKELGSEVAQRPDGQVVQQSKSFQSNQTNPNPDHDRTGQPVVGRDASHEPGSNTWIDTFCCETSSELVFVNWSRRSRTTLIDMLFKASYRFTGIHDRFLRDHVLRERMIQHNRDEEVCRAWNVLADEDHTYHLSQE